jgi:predicted ABC-type ATPase
MAKRILMIAGPNGAGKTTMALALMCQSPMLYEYLNSDEIAKALAPKNPESMVLTASKWMIKRLKTLLEEQQSLAFETTGAGTNYLRHLNLAKSKGYKISLTFLWLSSPKEAIKRVAQRVIQGGHHVPEELIIRRYFLGIKNLIVHYLPVVDDALIINNSCEEASSNRVIASINNAQSIDVQDKIIWQKMEQIANE